MQFAQRLVILENYVQQNCAPLKAPLPACTLIFSISDGAERAETVHATGNDVAGAWQSVVAALKRVMEMRKLEGRHLRVDWVSKAVEMPWSQFNELLHNCKRGYFRFGIAFDQDFSVLFTEQECNANAVFYGGGKVEHAAFNEKNFSDFKKRRTPEFELSKEKDFPVWKISTSGAYCAADGDIFFIPPPLNIAGPRAGLETGHRLIPDSPDLELLDLAITRSSRWLARQVQESGKYNYGYFPCFGRPISTYNALRHASSTYSLLEAWEYSKNPQLEAPVQRAIEYLASNLIKIYQDTRGKKLAFLVDDVSSEIKLGGNGVALLALTKWGTLTGSQKYTALMELLAKGIGHMQHPKTGEFVHVLHSADLSLKERYRTIYYDGEAVFGLLRLYGLTKNKAWLEMAKKSFDSFLDDAHANAHDHWLSYSVNEITQYLPEERYFRFGINNVMGFLDFILRRITTYPTLLELSMAAQAMFKRMAELPEMKHLMAGLDFEKFVKARDFRARHLLNGFFWPEMAMFYKKPEQIEGSCFIRHHAFRTRIDDVQHYLSGWIAYANMLKSGEAENFPQQELSDPAKDTFFWQAENLLAATNGEWAVPPAAGWQSQGICTYSASFKPSDMLVARSTDAFRGLADDSIKKYASQAAGIITTEPGRWTHLKLPILAVDNITNSLVALAKMCRENFQGKVISITGTSGKTSTVALGKHLFSPFGVTGSSLASANMLYGIAWNIAAMPYDAKWWIVEQSLARMDETSRLVKPDVAIVLNVAEAHLAYWGNTENIARQKSKIFTGMRQGCKAVVNIDMEHFSIFEEAAAQSKVELITFGKHEKADLRLLDVTQNLMRFTYAGKMHEVYLPVSAEYMALNCLSLLGAVSALGLPIEQFLAGFSSFMPVKGRGRIFKTTILEKNITVIDESYNANPDSMRAALSAYAGRDIAPEARIFVLADMLELGTSSPALHAALASAVLAAKPDRVLLYGPEMQHLWERISNNCQGKWYDSLEELRKELFFWLRDGDYLLIKGSQGTQLWKLAEELQNT